jgi:hypothetical protein
MSVMEEVWDSEKISRVGGGIRCGFKLGLRLELKPGL